jgi:hypothetical protein
MDFQSFMETYASKSSALLFSVEVDGRIGCVVKSGKRYVRRHPDFEELMIRTVEEGLAHDEWEGFVYVMFWKHAGEYVPLYIGKAERRGRKHPVSVNFERIRSNKGKFGRWGDGRDYHIGELSYALFKWTSKKGRDERYERWVERLFESASSLRLRFEVYVALIPWFKNGTGPRGTTVSVPILEQELIHLARQQYELLNTDEDPR